MADLKITQLTENTAPALEDLLAQVDDPSGTPTTKKTTIANVLLNTFLAPQGFLLNGKIVTSVTSNNLTVAIKGLNGNDPSATNPVFCRIGNTIRSITAALSVTKNAGTNWCNSGAAETATLEIDYFVYLGYNATDGVVIGFSRIPHARVYGDFSATSTAETYAAISTITNAAATDEYEVVGRFNAILSATASFNWSIPATSIVINRPIFETRILTWTPVWTGFSVNPSSITANYQIMQARCFVDIQIGSGGTSNATTLTMTLPIKVKNAHYTLTPIAVTDNGVNSSTPGHVENTAGSPTLLFFKAFYETAWTNSGSKSASPTTFSFAI